MLRDFFLWLPAGLFLSAGIWSFYGIVTTRRQHRREFDQDFNSWSFMRGGG